MPLNIVQNKVTVYHCWRVGFGTHWLFADLGRASLSEVQRAPFYSPSISAPPPEQENQKL
jgi:hypothetical protein